MMQSNKITSLVERFNQYSDWEDRYREMVKMGKAMPDLDEKFNEIMMKNPKFRQKFLEFIP